MNEEAPAERPGEEDQVFDVEGLYTALDRVREERGLSWRQVGIQTSQSPSLFIRLRNGAGITAEGLAKVARWAGLDLNQFVKGHSPSMDPLAGLLVSLRADPALSPQGARALYEVMKAMYRSFTLHGETVPERLTRAQKYQVYQEVNAEIHPPQGWSYNNND